MMVKICGITNQEDAAAADDAGVDAIGFNFCAASPRCITPEAAAVITCSALRVGVFVDQAPERVAAIARDVRLDIVQLHGSEIPADYAPLRVWKAYRVSDGFVLNGQQGAEAVLLDGPLPGSGQPFDWTQARHITARLILAGGLGPHNVVDAIKQVSPWGVDACSRLETSPGRKDHEKVRQFVRAARDITT